MTDKLFQQIFGLAGLRLDHVENVQPFNRSTGRQSGNENKQDIYHEGREVHVGFVRGIEAQRW